MAPLRYIYLALHTALNTALPFFFPRHCTSLFLSPSLHFPSSVPRALFPPRCAPPQPPYICGCTYWGAGRHCMLGGFAPGKLARVVYQRVLYRRDLRATYARPMHNPRCMHQRSLDLLASHCHLHQPACIDTAGTKAVTYWRYHCQALCSQLYRVTKPPACA